MHDTTPIVLTAPHARSLGRASAGWKTLAWALIAVGVLRMALSLERAPYRNDFAHYYLAANILRSGQNPYLTPLEPLCREYGLEYDRRIPTGANPPLLILAVSTIAWLPLPMAYGVWASAQATALLILLAVMRRLLDFDRGDARWLLWTGAVLNATCLLRQFHYSQVQIMVAACLAAALRLHVEGRTAASCALAALAAAFKIYPAALIPWFMLAGVRGFRDFRRRVLAVAGVGAAVLALTGAGAWQSFVDDGLPVINRSVGGSLTNYSLPALVSTLSAAIWGWPLPDDVANQVRWLGKALAAAALAAAYWVVWRRRLEPTAALGLLTAAMLAASLVCWSHYFVLMILPVAWIWRRASMHGQLDNSWPLLVAGSFCLWPELDYAIPLSGGLPRLALHYYPLAALSLVALLLVAPRTQRVAAIALPPSHGQLTPA